MAEILLFNIPAPSAGEDAAIKIHWYQSTDGFTWEPEVDSILISALPIDSTGKYRWDSALADPLKYHLLKTESANGLLGAFGVAVPPRSPDPSKCTVVADVITSEAEQEAGIDFYVVLKPSPQVVNGKILNMGMQQRTTDATGRATFQLVKGGKYEISSIAIPKPVLVDTTGKDLINISSLLTG